MFYRYPVDDWKYTELSWEERHNIAFALHQEYTGEGNRLDEVSINAKVVHQLERNRLKRMACYANVYKRLINTECKSYSQKGFRRKFSGANDKEEKRLSEIYYDELGMETLMVFIERLTAYVGTVLVNITIDSDNKMHPIVLSPLQKSLMVKTDSQFASIPVSVEYQCKTDMNLSDVPENWLHYYWDATDYGVYRIKDGKQEYVESPAPHGYNKLPFAVCRYLNDPMRLWGPVDYSAYSFCQTRSLLLSDAILRSQTSLFDILVFTGYTPEQAVETIKTMVAGKVIANPEPHNSADGVPVMPDVRYITPSMLEPEKIFALFENIYSFFLQARGHSRKNFDVGADVQSAEAQRNSDVYVRQEQQDRRTYLSKFERDLFEIIKWRNNSLGKGALKIGDKVQTIVDFVDQESFANIGEKIAWNDWRLRRNMVTIPQLMQEENPDLDEEMVEDLLRENTEKNAQNNIGINPAGDERLKTLLGIKTE